MKLTEKNILKGTPVLKVFLLPALLSIILFLFPSPSKAQVLDSLTETFYTELYSFRFQSAATTLRLIQKENKDPLLKEMLSVSYGWWMLISGENNKELSARLLDEIDRYIGQLESKKKLSQFEILHLILMYSYQARIHNHMQNRLSGFVAFRASNKYFKQLNPCDAIGCDIYNLVAGLYYALTGYIKEDYPAAFVFAFDREFADIDKGLALLNKCRNSNIHQVRTESNYFFMKLYLEVEGDAGKASQHAEMLIEKYPENLIFRLNQLLILDELEMEPQLEEACASFIRLTRNSPQLSECQKNHFLTECEELISRCGYHLTEDSIP